MRITRLPILILTLLSVALPAQAQLYPTPEPYIKANDIQAYLQAAVEFIQKNPNSADVPRVALDVLMVAGVQNNRQLFTQMQALLLLRHAGTLQATFILAQMNEQTYRGFLNGQGNAALFQNNKGLSTLWTRALREGVRQFGSRFMADSGFLLKSALIARDTDDQELKDALVKAINERKADDEDLRKWADICFASQATPDIVRALHGMRDDTTAMVLKQYYLVRMSPEQRRQPDMVAVIAEHLMSQGSYVAALEANTRLLESRDTAQVRFWKAWSEAAKQETERAVATLNELVDKYPDDAWAAAAKTYAGHLKTVDRNTADYANALVEATKLLKDGADVFEGRFVYRKAEDVFEVAAAYITGKYFEVYVKRNGKPMFGYKVVDAESWLYLDSEEKIRHYKEGSILPAPTLQLGPKPNGGLAYNTGVRLVNSHEGFTQAIQSITNAAGLGEQEAMANLVKAVLFSGSVPQPVDGSAAAGKRYTWLSPQVEKPEFTRTSYTIDKNNRFIAFAGSTFEATTMRYGPAASFTPGEMPAWPKREVLTAERPGLQEAQQLLQEIQAVFAPDESLATPDE